MNEGVYGSFASKLSETLISAPTVHKVSLKDSQWVSIHLLDNLIGARAVPGWTTFIYKTVA